jgi:ketosteroid isomerase-like protein
MKRILVTLMAATVALTFAACEQPAGNQSANTANANANTATPAAATPTAASLLEMDKAATVAFMSGDTKWFEENLSDKFVGYSNGKRSFRADQIKMVTGMKCDIKSSTQDDPQMSKIDDSTYVLVYKSTIDGECTSEGSTMKVPSPMRAATVWMREGDKWKGAFHSETPIIDPKDSPAAAPTKPAAKKDEAKKDQPAMDAETAKKEEMNTPTPSANTEALTKLHNGGWDAWRTNDAKWFNDTMIESVSYVDEMGTFHSGKAALTKLWTDATLCEGVTKTSFANTFASALTPTAEILTGKGTADGKCGGQANAPAYQTALYVKEGDAWKLAFLFSSPAR